MEYKIEIKNIPPTRLVRAVKDIPFSDLRKEATKLYELDKDNLDTALILLVHEPKLLPTTPVAISYPLKKYINLTDNSYIIDVIQRSKVVSTNHFGNYDTLEQSFQPLLDYIEKNGYTAIYPMRIIFHISAKYKALFKRNPNDFVTEIQIPIEE